MRHPSSRGFTLIEMLVVIAIIGVLVGLVIVSLNTARNRATETRIRSSVNQLRTIADVLYDSGTRDYSKVQSCIAFTGNPPAAANCGGQKVLDSILALRTEIYSANGGTYPEAVGASQRFCIAAKLNDSAPATGQDKYRCVDYSGAYKEGRDANSGKGCLASPPTAIACRNLK